MSKRKHILIITSIITILAVAFMISFNWGMKKFSEESKQKISSTNKISSDADKTAAALSSDKTVPPNAKVTLKIEYTKAGETMIKTAKTADFAGKSKSDLEKDDYTVESITSDEVVLFKKVDSYSPKKYILGIKDGYLAIFRTDDQGNLYIEDESTDVTDIEAPTEEDYNLLVKGSKEYQFDTKEQAEEKLGEYSS